MHRLACKARGQVCHVIVILIFMLMLRLRFLQMILTSTCHQIVMLVIRTPLNTMEGMTFTSALMLLLPAILMNGYDGADRLLNEIVGFLIHLVLMILLLLLIRVLMMTMITSIDLKSKCIQKGCLHTFIKLRNDTIGYLITQRLMLIGKE